MINSRTILTSIICIALATPVVASDDVAVDGGRYSYGAPVALPMPTDAPVQYVPDPTPSDYAMQPAPPPQFAPPPPPGFVAGAETGTVPSYFESPQAPAPFVYTPRAPQTNSANAANMVIKVRNIRKTFVPAPQPAPQPMPVQQPVATCNTAPIMVPRMVGPNFEIDPRNLPRVANNANVQFAPMPQPAWKAQRPVAAVIDAKFLDGRPPAVQDVAETMRYMPLVQLWDGSHGKYIGADGTRTVDDCGKPIWDDSIRRWDQRDFRDGFLNQTGQCADGTCAGVSGSAANGDATGQCKSGKCTDESATHYNSGPGKKAKAAVLNKDGWWDDGIDYEYFERYDPRDVRWNKGIKSATDIDTRSCPYDDAEMCRQWLAQYHNIYYLPRPQYGDGYVVPGAAPEPNYYAPTVPAPAPAMMPMQATPETCDPTISKSVFAAQYTLYPGDSATIVDIQSMYPGCPFQTAPECDIWKKKPLMREAVSNRSPVIPSENIDSIIALATAGRTIDVSSPDAAPLLNRYRLLQTASQKCCSDGMAYQLQRAGGSDGDVYKFLTDDANFYQFADRCLMMTDDELSTKYPNTATASVIADVRNGCVCRSRQWFADLLAPFNQLYTAAPGFKDQQLNYTFTDGLNRQITTDINTDVKNVLNVISNCP